MNEEGSLFDVPPAAIGRYLVRQPLGTGTTGPVFQAQDPASRALVTIKLLKVDLSPDEAHAVAQALTRLVGAMPRHDALVKPLDAGLDEIEAYFVTNFVEGESLEAALRDFGPAAIEDLVPRLRSLAGALDAAHRAGFVHGALHPRDVLVSPDTTHITGIGIAPVVAKAAVALPLRPPYSAPEVATGASASAAADQFALAAIAFEWLFGRRITGPAEGLVDVRELPGVDREALSNAFTIALAPDPETRFDSCRAFAEAVAAAVAPDQVAMLVDEAVMAAPLLHNEDPVGPFASEPARLDAIDPVAWNSSMTPEKTPERFGGGALIAATIVGLIVGFAAGYMAKPRALQSAPPRQIASVSSGSRAPAPASAPAPPRAPAPTPAPSAPLAPLAPITKSGRLLVRSSPSGATVSVDGVTRGVTPLALRDIALGSRAVVIARRGYIPEDRRVVLTSARPSRSLEVRLSTEAATPAAALRPTTPATFGRTAAATTSTGALAVDSRPSGATVTINGRPSGTTPLSLDAVAPGEYRVGLALAGYQPFSTTVRVVAGERVRAAASLSVQERE